MSIRQPRIILALGLLLALWSGAVGRAAANDATAELPAGGLAFVPASALAKESEELVIGRERIRVTYVIRNTSAQDLALWVSFPLPDIDMTSVGDQEVMLPSPDPLNFVEHETRVDDVRVRGETHQVAYAANRDVSRILQELAIPMFPFTDGLTQTLGELSEEVRRDLTERGILRHDAERAEPGWTLKTSFSWRQVFPAGKAVRIVHSYRPIPSSRSYSAGEVAAVAKAHCVDAATQSGLAERTAGARDVSELLTVTYLASASSVWWGKSGDFRIAIEKQDPATVVSTCLRGLRVAGPTLLEWSGRDITLEDDIHVLFAR